MNVKRLREVPLFAGLGKRDVEAIAQLADEIDVAAGRVIAQEGDLGREFFVVESGTATVTREGAPVAELGPGDFFGEMALIDEQRRTATVTAETPMELIVLTSWQFRSLRSRMPTVHQRVSDEIARRRSPAAGPARG